MSNTSNTYHLFQSLKDYSSAESNGLLNVFWSEKSIDLIFEEGLIVGCRSDDLKTQMLKKLENEYQIKGINEDILSSEVQLQVCLNYDLLPEEVKKIQKDLERKEIESIFKFRGGRLNFQNSLLTQDRNYLLKISPGSLMLDFVEQGESLILEQEEEKNKVVKEVVTKTEFASSTVNVTNLSDQKLSGQGFYNENKKLSEDIFVSLKKLDGSIVEGRGAEFFYLCFGVSILLFSIFKINSDLNLLYSLLSKLSKFNL